MSVSFDQAADYYDRTRVIPDSVMAQLVPVLAEQLPKNELCLEIGIGTGRIALPLVDAEVRVIGVDIAREMLRKLIEKKRGAWPHIAIADATALPFGDQTFGSAVASHVLHLIPGWRAAVTELMRVVRPGGVLLVARGGRDRSPWVEQVSRRFFQEAGDPPWPPGASSIDDVDAAMSEHGVTARPLPNLGLESVSSLEQVIHAMEAGYWAACWAIDPAVRTRAASATREWARRELGDLDAERRGIWESSTWHAYDLPEQR
ncbi:MAG TPA: class I SAM-dependent methyltransferase [Candidatus Dormibacteraeota bacterium]|nr:class I SAM-dependent methyltransferase [Candidatus Dormibacteraeota bacterium]